MKFKTVFLVAMVLFLGWAVVSCGSSGNGTTTTTGTVVVSGGTTTSANLAARDVTAMGTPTNVYVHPYKAEFTTDATCPVGETGWVTIFDETADESDCIHNLSTTSIGGFMDISSNPEFGSNGAVPAGTYNCMRVTMCDHQLGITDADVGACPAGEYVLDIYGDWAGGHTDIAEITIKYFSTLGTAGGTGTTGEQDDPHLMSSFDVTGGGTTNIILQFDITDTMRYNPDSDTQCYIEAPTLTIVTE